MKNKKYLFLLILLFPAGLKLILEFTTINSSKLPYYGVKTAKGKDTIYQIVNEMFTISSLNSDSLSGLEIKQLDTIQYPIFVVSFIKQAYKKDNYRMAGLSEYIQFNKTKIKEIPFMIVTPCDGKNSSNCFNEFEKMSVDNSNILNLFWESTSFDSINFSYFKAKPYYIDYSFFVLVDKQRHIRGYYDGRYVSEIKRLMDEYQHLRLKEEKQDMLNQNKIESK
jgi:hypothetical protein